MANQTWMNSKHPLLHLLKGQCSPSEQHVVRYANLDQIAREPILSIREHY
jgi:hypothetical protein